MAVNRKVDGSNPSGRVFRPITSYWLAPLIMFVSAHFGDLSFAWLGSHWCGTYVDLSLMWMKAVLWNERIEMEFGAILGR